LIWFEGVGGDLDLVEDLTAGRGCVYLGMQEWSVLLEEGDSGLGK